MNEEEPNYEEIIDDEFSFPRFSEDPTEQNRLNVRHALKKSTSGMPLTEIEQNLLIDNGLDDFVRGGQTQAAGVDAALIAAPFLAKPALLSPIIAGGANLIKKYPLKSLEVGLTGLGASDAIDNPQDLVLETLGMKTDTMFSGGKKGPFNPVANKGIKITFDKLSEIFTKIFDGPNPKFATEGGEIPNTFFMSKSDNTGGRFVPPTSKQIYDTKQKLITNNIADGTGRFIWEQFSKNKKGRSNWGRLMSKEVQTLPYSKETWSAIKKELQNDFSSIYPDSLLKNIKVQNSKGQWVALQKKNIEIEHIFTLQQSMPMFADVEWGGKIWNEIAQQVLSRQFSMGDTRQNLIAVPQHIHRIKTQFFNKFAGIDGTKFWTKDVIAGIKVDEAFRKQKIDEWLDKVEEGKKIIDDGLVILETLYKGKPIPNMPEELVEKLSNIRLDEVDIKKVIPQIFAEFEAEGFTNTALKKADLATEKIEDIKLNKRKIQNADYNESVEYFKKATEQWNKQNTKFTPWDNETDAIEYATEALKSQFVDKNGQLKFFNKSGMTLEEAANIYGNLLFETNRAR